MPFTVAIIGRPNVGKSTLFNRLIGKRLALVDDQPGVTRDLREGEARLGDLSFTVIDTAGLDDATDDSLAARMSRLSERAMERADLCLFLVDARAGLTPADEVFAELLRRRGVPVIVCANKAEGRDGEVRALEAYALGLGDVVPISAEHGEGMSDLYAALSEHAGRLAGEAAGEVSEDDEEGDALAEGRPLRIAVVGRPNAGKSTLINAILGEDRLLTGPEPGITRDAIAVTTNWGGRAFRIFDTAGLRRKARIHERVEKLSTADALHAIRLAEVVVVLMDEANAFETQDLRIADLAEREGRAVVLGIAKWDLVEDRQARSRELRETFERLLPQLRGAPLVTVSALTGRGLDRLREAILEMHRVWNTRISTARLNRWLGEVVEAHPPPAVSGRRVRLRFMTQVKARPPSFVAWCSRPEALPESYQRYLVNGLREAFGLAGVPIRLAVRKGENPYDKKR